MPLSPTDLTSTILDLDDAGPLTGEEFTIVVQDGNTVKIPIDRAGSSLFSPPLLLSFANSAPIQVGARTSTRAPAGMTINKVKMSATVGSTFGVVSVDVRRNGTSILSTPLTMDVGETSSVTAAVAVQLQQVVLAEDDEVSAVVVASGSGVIGLQVWLVGAKNEDRPPEPPPPPPPSERIEEGFDGGLDGEEVNEISTTFDTSVGAGSLTHSALASVDGGTCMRVFGTTQHYVRKTLPVDTLRKRRFYQQVRAASTGTAWLHNTWAGDGTTVAFRYGVTPTRQITLQAGTNGSGAGLDSTTVPLAQLEWANFEVTAVGGTSARLAIYSGVNVNNTGEVGAHDVLQVTITAPDFGDVGIGLMEALAGGGTVTSANLISESFTFTTDNQPVTEALLPGAKVFGSGAMTTNVGTFAGGDTSGVQVNGTTSHYGVFERSSHTYRGERIRLRYDAPMSGTGATTHWFDSQRDASSTGYQVGVGTDGKLRARRNTNGTGNEAIIMANAWTPGTEYDVIIEATAGGALTLGYVPAATIDANPNAALTENVTMVSPLTVTSFANTNWGQPTAPPAGATPANLTILRWSTSTTGVPSPPNATGGSAVDVLIDAWVEDAVNMPPIHEVYIGGEKFDAINQPLSGCLWGASCAPVGATGTNAEGVALYESFARRRPDVLHFFKSSHDWNGLFSTAEKDLLTPTGKTRAIPFFNWKVRGRGTYTCQQVRDGVNDANIIRWARNIATYPWKVFIGLDHEPDGGSGGSIFPTAGNSANEYADMWRHVVQLAKANGAKNVIWAWIMTGYSGNAGASGATYNAAWPGDDVVDWVCWDPYWTSNSKPDFYGAHENGSHSLLAENVANTSGWDAVGRMYGWATTPKTVGGSGNSAGLRYTFGGGKPVCLAEFGVSYTLHTDAQGESRIRSIAEQIQSAPRVKMLLYWNSATEITYQINGHPLSEDAYGDVGNSAFFNVGIGSAK